MPILHPMIKIIAYKVAENINIKKFKAEHTGDLISGSSFELFYHYKGGYVYVFNYGVAVFANVDDIDRDQFIEYLKDFCENLLNKRLQEDFVIEHNPDSLPIFSYNALSIPMIQPKLIGITMLQVGQSVALDFYQERSQHLFEETVVLTSQLEKFGQIKVSKKKLLQFIGRALNTKNRILDNLYIFSSPASTWEDELLDKVHDGLTKTFDINTRFHEVEYMLKNIESNLAIFVELHDVRAGHRLEIVIIILILIEVLDMAYRWFL